MPTVANMMDRRLVALSIFLLLWPPSPSKFHQAIGNSLYVDYELRRGGCVRIGLEALRAFSIGLSHDLFVAWEEISNTEKSLLLNMPCLIFKWDGIEMRCEFSSVNGSTLQKNESNNLSFQTWHVLGCKRSAVMKLPRAPTSGGLV